MDNLTPTELKHLSHKELINLVDRGILKVMLAQDTISTREIIPMGKEDTPEYRAVAHLKGQAIHLGKAARKYGIAIQTISRWVKKGYIDRLGTDGQKVLVDEADVAYCAAIYQARGGQGRWLFDDLGRPYIPKHDD